MWLIELLWGVLLLEIAESLFKAERGEGEEKRALLKEKQNKTKHTIWMLYMNTRCKPASDKVGANHIA